MRYIGNIPIEGERYILRAETDRSPSNSGAFIRVIHDENGNWIYSPKKESDKT